MSYSFVSPKVWGYLGKSALNEDVADWWGYLDLELTTHSAISGALSTSMRSRTTGTGPGRPSFGTMRSARAGYSGYRSAAEPRAVSGRIRRLVVRVGPSSPTLPATLHPPGSHNSTLFPSGSVNQPNRPYSISSISSTTSAPPSATWASAPSRSSTTRLNM